MSWAGPPKPVNSGAWTAPASTSGSGVSSAAFRWLKDLPPIYKSDPQTTAPDVVERIHALALEHPAYRCNRLEAILSLEGTRVSAITIQELLNDHGLGTWIERWQALEETKAIADVTPEQAAFLEKLNPCYCGRRVESAASSELLSADTFLLAA